MKQTFIQILLLIVSGVAVFTIVIPTFNEIGNTQKESDEYTVAIENAFATNDRLNALVGQANNLSQQERYRLERLVPNTIDSIKTAFDLEVLIEKSNLFLVSLDVNEELFLDDPVMTSSAETTLAGGKKIAYQQFDLVIVGTYGQFKIFLADLESSAQLFDIESVRFDATDSDITQYDLTIRSYGLEPNFETSL